MIRVRSRLLGTAGVLFASSLIACGGDEATVAPAQSNGGAAGKAGAAGAAGKAGGAGTSANGGSANGGTSAGGGSAGTSAGGSASGGTTGAGFGGTGQTGGTTSSGGSSATAGTGGTAGGTGGTAAGTGGTAAGTGGTAAGTGGTTAGTGGTAAGTGGTAGTSAGGTDAGGNNAGGTDAGGNNAGGNDAGGNNAGGNDAGGNNAGGSAGAAGGCDADELLCGGVCINPATNAQNCGACGTACGKDEVCAVGICNGGCQSGETACGLVCADLKTDEAHCGTCGTVCAAGSECTNGVCKIVCSGGESDCGGTCKDLAKDNANCGSCGTACGPTEKCSAGVCQTTCTGGTTQCGAQCVDQQTDEANCGGCGTACPAAQSCNAGKCECPLGQTLCGNQCVDLQSDEAHCGTCATTCAANTQTCNAGVCTATCESQLIGNSLKDQWGFTWDGNERTSTTLVEAEKTCGDIGGRLPTASEVYRVSAVRTSQVGQSSNANPLWTNVPNGPTAQARVALSSGAVTSQAVGTNSVYRCVCAPPKTEGYQGRDCHGTSGPNCTERTQHGTTNTIDNADRAKLTLSQAEWECQFDGGQLPSAAEYAELTNRVFDVAGASSLPITTTRWTSDSIDGATQITAARNASNATVFTATTNTTPTQFRCIGAKRLPSASTGPANAFVHPTTGVRLDATERNATTYVGAVDLCLASGGHIPPTIDLADAAFAGATGGALPLWTSEHGEPSSVVRLKWLAAQPRWTWTNGTITTAATTGVLLFSKNSGANPATSNYRCSYYPVEAGYVGPDAATCADQGCLETAFAAGAGKPKLWVDKTDRQAATWVNASRTCAGLGGHLATREDLVVSIRNGLTFGSGAAVWAGDLATATTASVVKWSGTQASFDDRTASTTTTSVAITTTNVFRCAWTNEVR